MGLAKKVWESLKTAGSVASGYYLLSLEEEEFERERSSTFDRAKRISDFVGMIVRVSFLFFAVLYGLKLAPSLDGLLSYAVGFTTTSGILLLIALFAHVSRLIFLWEVREARKFKARIPRFIFLGSALFITWSAGYTIYKLVSAIALESALLSSV